MEDQITQYIQNILQREPAPGEVHGWIAIIEGNVATLEEVRQMIIDTAEAVTNVYPMVLTYQAIYGRVPDADGLEYWTNVYASNLGLDDPATTTVNEALVEVLKPFVDPAQTPEFIDRYGANPTGDQFVAAAYQNVLNRVPDQDGLTYWQTRYAQIEASYADSGMTQDEITVQVRAEILEQFVNSAEYKTATAEEVDAYLTARAEGEDVSGSLWDLDPDANVGQTFTLTTNLDNIQGTSGDDVIGGTANTTLQAFDTINGDAGYDTLKVALAANYGGGASISNVEEIQLTSAGFNFNATGIAGVKKFVNNGSSGALGVTGVTGAVDLDVNNIASQTTTLTFAGGLTGSDDTVNLGLNNVTGGAASAIQLTAATAAINELEKVVITTSGAASNVRLDTNGTQTSLKTIEIAGNQNLTLALNGDNTATSATTINASALTGNLTISGFGAAAHTVTGGSGNDTFSFAGNFGSTDKVDGGAGANTLSANGAQLAAITTKLADVKNIQTLMLANDVANTGTTVNAANFGSVTNVRIANQATKTAAVTFNGLTAAADGASNNIRFDGDLGTTGGFTFNITGATDPGTANAVTLDMRGTTTATSTINLAGVETVTIDATNATGTQLFNLGAASLKSLTVKGTQAVDIDGAALGANVESVDASGLTVGGLNVALNGTAATGANIVGSGQADLVLGSNLKDVISTGGGADIVVASRGQDVITLGDGADLFRIRTGANAQTAANSVTIKDFVAGTDDISLNVGAGSVFTGVTFTAGTSTAAAMADALSSTTAVNSLDDVYTQLGTSLTVANFAPTATAAAANQLVARVVEFTTGDAAGKYLVINDSNPGFQAATDIVINVTGVTGTISAADFVFG